MKVAIIGGGVVGLSCAYALRRRGASVTVFDRDDFGQSTSKGNTGWVVPSMVAPLARPGVLRDAAVSIVKRKPPLILRPTLDPLFLNWLARFIWACGEPRFQAGLDALVALDRRSLDLFDEYQQVGVEFEVHRSGLVIVAHSKEALTGYARLFTALAGRGHIEGNQELSPQEAVALETALDAAAVGGALHARSDRYVRPEAFTSALAAHLQDSGVELLRNTPVFEIRRRPLAVRGPNDTWTFDAIVVAAGVESRKLLAPLGYRAPMIGAKGYSVTFPLSPGTPSHALYLTEPKVGVSSYDTAVRIAGMFEYGRADRIVNASHVMAMLRSADSFFSAWRPSSAPRVETWAGLRPATPDGLPLLGRLPRSEDVFVATGHGQLGVMLAPATGEYIAPLVLEGQLAPELEPFRLERFAGRPSLRVGGPRS